MKRHSSIVISIILLGSSGYALSESGSTLPIETLHAATQRLHDVYKHPEYSAIPSSLERFHFNLLRMMVFDPDRGDPWDSRKSEKAWQMTERSAQEWLEVLPTLSFCSESADAVRKFGDVVREIHDNRRKLFYRASRALVKSGRLDEAYQALTESLGRCAQPADDEMELVFSAQRRFRFQKLGLAIDDFYRQYWEKYPEDRDLITKAAAEGRLNAPAVAAPLPVPPPPQAQVSPQPAQTGKASQLPWLPALALVNFAGLLALFIHMRRALHKATPPAVLPHEPQLQPEAEAEPDPAPEPQRILLHLQTVFSEIFESEEFLKLVVDEAQSIQASERNTYIRVLTEHIETIHRILSGKDGISSMLLQLAETQKAIQTAIEATSAHKAFTTLLRIISEYQDRLKPLEAA